MSLIFDIQVHHAAKATTQPGKEAAGSTESYSCIAQGSHLHPDPRLVIKRCITQPRNRVSVLLDDTQPVSSRVPSRSLLPSSARMDRGCCSASHHKEVVCQWTNPALLTFPPPCLWSGLLWHCGPGGRS